MYSYGSTEETPSAYDYSDYSYGGGHDEYSYGGGHDEYSYGGSDTSHSHSHSADINRATVYDDWY